MQKVLPDTEIRVVCPDTFDLCRIGAMCPNDCSNKGRCKSDGKCWCYPSFAGDDCSLIQSTPYTMTTFNSTGYDFPEVSLILKVCFGFLTGSFALF